MDKNQKQISENEEVISPEVRVGPAKKEKYLVSVQNAVKYFPFVLFDYIRTLSIFHPKIFRIIFLLSMQICGITFASGTKMLMSSTSMIYMEDKKALVSV